MNNDNWIYAIFFVCILTLLMMVCVCTTVYNLATYKIDQVHKVEVSK